MVVVRRLAVVCHLAVGIYLRQLRCAGLARLADGGVRRRGAGREKDGKTDNADGCPQGLRKGRTHRTVEQALTPDNATIGKGTIFTSAAAASQRLKMAERSEEHTSELQSLMR